MKNKFKIVHRQFTTFEVVVIVLLIFMCTITTIMSKDIKVVAWVIDDAEIEFINENDYENNN